MLEGEGMKAIMVMFDSLNRHMLPSYGCDWIKAPNFERLTQKAITFDQCYVGSLPCMPARRELHTGRLNFLHRSWGPIEPFDDSMPEILKNNGVHSHLVSDHQHYWEDGGCTYHTRYSTWEISRGQEGDPWKGHVATMQSDSTPFRSFKAMTKSTGLNMFKQDQVNRMYMENESKMPQAVTFRRGLEFIEQNKEEDQWFLQIETFDPHEPFFAPDRFRQMYPDDEYDGIEFDWPPYAPVMEADSVVEHGRKRYAALLSMCDEYLGKVLDIMDEHDMWKDTMLIVNTDHGYLLGEHGWWSKSVMPTYNEIAHVPFWIWDPRHSISGERRSSLVQSIDIAPTLLDFFELPIPDAMQGKNLKQVVDKDLPVRDYAIFGYHGGHINITDGRHLYMRAPMSSKNEPLYEYTLMPTHMRKMFDIKELQETELCNGFKFAKGCKLMKIKAVPGFVNAYQFGHKLFDLKNDPGQKNIIEDPIVEERLKYHMIELMKENEAPQEQYERMGFVDTQDPGQDVQMDPYTWNFDMEAHTKRQVMTLLNFTEEKYREEVVFQLNKYMMEKNKDIMTKTLLKNFISEQAIEEDRKDMLLYFTEMAGRTS